MSIKKRILSNFSALAFLQAINILMSVIYYPYLIRVLGASTYGMVAFGNSISAFALIFVGFGFNVSATRLASIHRDDPHRLSEIYSCIFLIKVGLLSTLALSFCALANWVSILHAHKLFFSFFLFYSINDILVPQWLFQGIERMKPLVIANTIANTLFPVSVVIFIKVPADVYWLPLCNIACILVSYTYAFPKLRSHSIRFCPPRLQLVTALFKEGFPFFLSRLSTVIVLEFNTLLIGQRFGMKEVSYYDLAKKIVTLSKIPFSTLNDAIYPIIARTQDMRIVRKTILYAGGSSIVFYLLIVLCRTPVVYVLGGHALLPAKPVIAVLGLSIPLATISYFLGNTTLIVMGYSNYYNRSVIYESILFLILSFIVMRVPGVNILYLAAVVVLVSFFEMAYRFHYVHSKNLLHL